MCACADLLPLDFLVSFLDLVSPVSRPLLGLGKPPLCRVDSKLHFFSSNLIGEWQRFPNTTYNQFEHWHRRWKSESPTSGVPSGFSFSILSFIDTSFTYHHHHNHHPWDDSLHHPQVHIPFFFLFYSSVLVDPLTCSIFLLLLSSPWWIFYFIFLPFFVAFFLPFSP